MIIETKITAECNECSKPIHIDKGTATCIPKGEERYLLDCVHCGASIALWLNVQVK